MTNVLSILRVLFGFKILFWLVQSLLLFIFSVFFVKPEIFMDESTVISARFYSVLFACVAYGLSN